MNINYANPPEESVRVLVEGLREIANLTLLEDKHKIALERALSTATPFIKPHRAFFLGLNELVTSQNLQKAELVSWRYFIPSELLLESAAAEVNVDPSRSKHSFSSFCRRTCKPTMSEFLRAESAENLIDGSFELSLLRVPGLHFSALWLKNVSGTEDLFIPSNSGTGPSDSVLIFTRDQLLETLKVTAAKELIGRTATSS